MRILINRTDAIGDTLLTLPMAWAFKEQDPEGTVVFISSPVTAPLLEGHPSVESVWILSPKDSLPKSFLDLRKKMASFRPDAYFHCGGSFLPTLVAFSLGVPFRGGVKSRWPSFFLLNKGLRQQRTEAGRHESAYNLELLAPLGIPVEGTGGKAPGPTAYLSEKEKGVFLKEFKDDLRREGLDGTRPMIFIHPGMTGHSLNWPPSHYAHLVQRIEEGHPNTFLFVISHTPGDSAYITPLREEMERIIYPGPSALFYFDGARRGLRHYMAVLSEASLLVAPSTGNTHMANALRIPQVAIYSPLKAQSHLRWGPLRRGRQTALVAPSVVCPESRRCRGPRCREYPCMEKITVEEVYRSVLDLLGLKR